MHQCRQPRTVDGFGQDIDGTERKADAALRRDRDHDHRNVAEVGVGLERRSAPPSRQVVGIMTSSVIASGRIVRARFRASVAVGGMNQAISGAFQTGGQAARVPPDHRRRSAPWWHCSHRLDVRRLRRRDLRRRFSLVRQSDRECRTFTGLARNRDIAAQQLAETPGNRQAKAGAAVLLASWKHRPG